MKLYRKMTYPLKYNNMIVNLKKHVENIAVLKHIQTVLRTDSINKRFVNKLENIIRFYEDVETDLELGGESIIELDMPRTKAIEERNKFISFLNNEDEI